MILNTWLKGGWFSIKDVEILNDDIYVSYTKEVSKIVGIQV